MSYERDAPVVSQATPSLEESLVRFICLDQAKTFFRIFCTEQLTTPAHRVYHMLP